MRLLGIGSLGLGLACVLLISGVRPATANCNTSYSVCMNTCKGGRCPSLCEAGKKQCATTGHVCLPSGWCHPKKKG